MNKEFKDVNLYEIVWKITDENKDELCKRMQEILTKKNEAKMFLDKILDDLIHLWETFRDFKGVAERHSNVEYISKDLKFEKLVWDMLVEISKDYVPLLRNYKKLLKENER